MPKPLLAAAPLCLLALLHLSALASPTRASGHAVQGISDSKSPVLDPTDELAGPPSDSGTEIEDDVVEPPVDPDLPSPKGGGSPPANTEDGDFEQQRSGRSNVQTVMQTQGGGSLNLFSGGLNIVHPITTVSAGGRVNIALSAVHDSKSTWRFGRYEYVGSAHRDEWQPMDGRSYLPYGPITVEDGYPDIANHMELGWGWTLNLGRVGFQSHQYDKFLISPDGSPHKLYQAGTADNYNSDDDRQNLVTRDGSRYRVTWIGPSANYDDRTYKAFAPDGTIIEYGHWVSDDVDYVRVGWYPTTIIDVFGNRVDIEYWDSVPGAEHVIRRIYDSHHDPASAPREVTTTLTSSSEPALDGLIESITYPSPSAAGTTTTFFDYVLKTDLKQPPHLGPPAQPILLDHDLTVPLLERIRGPEGLTHEFVYNEHGEVIEHVTPHGGTVEYDYENYTFSDTGLYFDEFGPVILGRGVASHKEIAGPGAVVAEWQYERDQKSAEYCGSFPPGWVNQYWVSVKDPYSNWRSIGFAIDPEFEQSYLLATEFGTGARALPELEFVFDEPFENFPDQACQLLPAGVGTRKLTTNTWELDDFVVKEYGRYFFYFDAMADYNARLVRSQTFLFGLQPTEPDDPPAVQAFTQIDNCDWDGFGHFGRSVIRGGTGWPQQRPRVYTQKHAPVTTQWILDQQVEDMQGEFKHPQQPSLGGVGSRRERRFSVDGQLRQEVADADLVEFGEELDCYVDPGLGAIRRTDAYLWIEDLWADHERNWPDFDNLIKAPGAPGGILDPQPPPHAPLTDFPVETSPIVQGSGDLVTRWSYYGSRLQANNSDSHGHSAWGHAATESRLLHASPSTATFDRRFEWAFGSPEQERWDAFSWYSLDNDIDPSTGAVRVQRDSAGVGLEYEYDDLWRVRVERPLPLAPPPSNGALLEAPLTTDYSTNQREISKVRGFAGAPAAERTEEYELLDGFGRTIMKQRRQPGGNLATRSFGLDELGRAELETEWWESSAAPFVWAMAADLTRNEYWNEVAPGVRQYDPLGRLQAIERADGARAEFRHNATQVRRSVAGINGDPNQVAVSTEHVDSWGRLIKVETPAGGADAEYDYDHLGNLSWSSLDGQERIFEHDALGRLRRQVTPEFGTISYELHDAQGNLLRMTDPRGFTVVRKYDMASRKINEVTEDGLTGTFLQSFTYDGPGPHASGKIYRTRSRSMPSGTDDFVQTVDYEGTGGRASRVLYDIGSLSWESDTVYDSLGQVVARGYPRPTGSPATRIVDTVYEYGLPVGQPGFLDLVAYTPSGQPWLTAFPNGTETRMDVDPRNRPLRIQVTTVGGGSTLWHSGTYTYDGAGQVLTIGTAAEVPAPDIAESYVYDLHGRLVEARHELGADRHLELRYDAWGNMTDRLLTEVGPDPDAECQLSFSGREYTMLPSNLPGSTVTNRISDLGTSCLVSGAGTVTYDPIGNLTLDHHARYEWDALNRLTTLRPLDGAPKAEYGYDVAGNRVVKSVGGVTTYFLRDGEGSVLTEWEDSGSGPALQEERIYLGSTLIALVQEGSVEWQHPDHVGSTRVISDEVGSIRRYMSSPFGVSLPTPDGGWDDGDDLFAGHERDLESDLVYMMARYESPRLARFLSPDSGDDVEPTRPQSWNKYAYVSNNPLAFDDPDGKLQRDKSGALIFTPTAVGQVVHGRRSNPTAMGYVQFGYLYADDGTPIEASTTRRSDPKHRTGEYQYPMSKPPKDLPNDKRNPFYTNCHGTSVGDGEYWINNDQLDKIIKGDNWVRVSERKARVGDLVVYRDGTGPVHSVRASKKDPSTGDITEVEGLGGLETAKHPDKRGPGPGSAWPWKASVEYYSRPPGPPTPPTAGGGP